MSKRARNQLRADFGRVWRFAMGAPGSPGSQNAALRLLDHINRVFHFRPSNSAKTGGRPAGTSNNDQGLDHQEVVEFYVFRRSELPTKADAARETHDMYWGEPPTGKKLEKFIAKMERWADGRFPPRDL